MRSFQTVTASCLITVAAALPAYAQGMDPGHSIPTPAPAAKVPDRPAPAAIPGAESRPDTAAPADRAAADLPPTEALFDAINRGDMAAAKDSIGRGADLDGQNLLGLSPLELSVDLGRNDISFLLLSLRGESGSSRSTASVQTAPAPSSKLPQRRTRGTLAAGGSESAARTLVAPRPPAAPARQAPPLFAGNGGTPLPNAGFLGFDPHR